MPLIRGKGRKIWNANVERLMKEGYPRDQAEAIAYSKQTEKKVGQKKRRKDSQE